MPIQQKFKHLKTYLKGWNKTHFGQVDKNLKVMEHIIELLEGIAELRPLSIDEDEKLSNLFGKKNVLSKRVESL